MILLGLLITMKASPMTVGIIGFVIFACHNIFDIPLAGVYLVWVTVIVLLYLPCRRFSAYKKANRQWCPCFQTN